MEGLWTIQSGLGMAEWRGGTTGGNLCASSYLVGTVTVPLFLGQTQSLLVPSGPILAVPMFLLDTAHWFTNVLVAREARALTVTGLEVRICMGIILVQVGR